MYVHIHQFFFPFFFLWNAYLFQVKEDLMYLEGFQEAVNAGFQDGLPLHLSAPEKSLFRVMTELEFEDQPIQEIQNILRRQNIIVTEMRAAPLKFDSLGLSTLTGLSTVTDFQGE